MPKGSTKLKQLLKSGKSAFNKGDYSKSISYYLNAIKLCEQSAGGASRSALADAYNGVGHALRSKGQFKKAYEFQKRALITYRALGKSSKSLDERTALALHYTADVLTDLKQPNKALSLSRKELQIARRLYSRNKRGQFYLIYALNGTAWRLSDKKKFRNAISLLNESLRIQSRAPRANAERNFPNLSWTYYILGKALLGSGDHEKAIVNLKKALSMRLVIADKNRRYIPALRNTLRDLSIAYSKKGNTKSLY